MKKFFLISFIILFPNLSNAHMSHYSKLNKIEMDIYRNGEIIGYSNYYFEKNGEEIIVTNKTKFSVKIFGTTVFKIDSFSEEKYVKNKLISYNSTTLQNDKKKFCRLIYNKKKDKFDIEGSSYNGEASTNNVIGNWWNHEILQTNSQISPISGSIKEQVVTFVGNQKIEQYGKLHEVEQFTLRSKDMKLPKDKRLNFNIWYDKKNSIILRISYSRMGNWEYRLKNFE